MSFFGYSFRNFDRQRPGRVIAARTLNGPIDATADASRARVGTGMASVEVAGVPCERAVASPERWARLSASNGGGSYTFVAVYQDRATPGTWHDLPANLGGTCHEANGNASLATGTRVLLRREWASQAWTFIYGACS